MAFSAKTPWATGLLRKDLRWLDRYSPLRGCSGLAVSASHKIPRRRTPLTFQTGSELNSYEISNHGFPG